MHAHADAWGHVGATVPLTYVFLDHVEVRAQFEFGNINSSWWFLQKKGDGAQEITESTEPQYDLKLSLYSLKRAFCSFKLEVNMN